MRLPCCLCSACYVFDVFVVCIVHTMSLVAFAYVELSLSISFILLQMLLVYLYMDICVSEAFVLSFLRLSNIRSFPFA